MREDQKVSYSNAVFLNKRDNLISCGGNTVYIVVFPLPKQQQCTRLNGVFSHRVNMACCIEVLSDIEVCSVVRFFCGQKL